MWTRIYKFSPNFDGCFDTGLKQNCIIPHCNEDDSISIDYEICITDQDDSSNEDTVFILTIFITSEQ